jgi:hypothetical protein
MCDSCQAVKINGVLCHEAGCPDKWKNTVRECKWCGNEFTPEDRQQAFCNSECYCNFYNIPYEMELA